MKKKKASKKNEDSDFIAKYIEKQFVISPQKIVSSKKTEDLIPPSKEIKKQYFA